jgi:hypothetical protein
MAKTSNLRGFSLPLHLATGSDHLRPAMTNVYFEGDYMFATDAHIAVRAKIKTFTNFDFDDDEIKMLDGKFIHRTKFKTIYNATMVKVERDGILSIGDDILYKFTKQDGKYPNLDKLLNERLQKESCAHSLIGLNPKFLDTLHKAMTPYGEVRFGLHLHFAKTKEAALERDRVPAPIIVKHPDYDFSDLVGLIMPVNTR